MPCRDEQLIPRWVWLTAAVFALATTVPFLYGWLCTPPGYVFLWRSSANNSVDMYQYLSWVRQAAEGKWLFEDLYTTEPHRPALFHLLFLLMGLLARATGASMPTVYHAVRIVLAFLLVPALYWTAGVFVRDRQTQRWTVLFILAVSGLGLSARTPDVLMPELSALLSSVYFPLFTCATLLTSLILGHLWLAVERESRKHAVTAGLLTLILSLVHIHEVPTIWAGALAYTAWVLYARRSTWPALLPILVVVISTPGVAYQAWLLTSPPVFRELSQALKYLFRPRNPLWVLSGFHVQVVLITLGVLLRRRQPEQGRGLLAACAVASFVCACTPLIRGGARLAAAMQIPMNLLAAGGVEVLVSAGASPCRLRYQRAVRLSALLLVSSLSSARVILADVAYYAERAGAAYLPAESMDALRWLSTHSRPDQVLLTSEELGNLVPAITGRRTYLGHYHMSLRARTKRRLVKAFFSAHTPTPRKEELLSRFGASLVVFTPLETLIGLVPPVGLRNLIPLPAPYGCRIWRVQLTPGTSDGAPPQAPNYGQRLGPANAEPAVAGSQAGPRRFRGELANE
ncbi:MAG: hypothetical protein ACUVTZ_03105 [Armatimonadota bacterium]